MPRFTGIADARKAISASFSNTTAAMRPGFTLIKPGSYAFVILRQWLELRVALVADTRQGEFPGLTLEWAAFFSS
jgi:hypothetical protein